VFRGRPIGPPFFDINQEQEGCIVTATAELSLDHFRNEQHTRSARPRPSLFDSIGGHFWTVAPELRASVLPPAQLSAMPFNMPVMDSAIGKVNIRGLLNDAPASETLVVIIHGVGGSAYSLCCLAAAKAVERTGHASLRLSLRGADLSGEDFYHCGLTDDLRAALASPELRRFRRVFLLGYSLGGHIALRAAIEQIDPRLRGVAAICPPLDLIASAAAFDAPGQTPYRRYIFAGLNRIYAAVAARQKVPSPVEVVCQARTCAERDELTVVPRFGFASARDYYLRAGVAPVIHQLAIPSLIVASLNDPLVPPHTLRPAVANASSALTVRWVEKGGHIYFPSGMDLGFGGGPGLEHQVVSWLSHQ
jgi:predicted alpha/beta-fold hydrolase